MHVLDRPREDGIEAGVVVQAQERVRRLAQVADDRQLAGFGQAVLQILEGRQRIVLRLVDDGVIDTAQGREAVQQPVQQQDRGDVFGGNGLLRQAAPRFGRNPFDRNPRRRGGLEALPIRPEGRVRVERVPVNQRRKAAI